jgi:hypothetical protein
MFLFPAAINRADASLLARRSRSSATHAAPTGCARAV